MGVEGSLVGLVDFVEELFDKGLACGKLALLPEELHQQQFNEDFQLNDLGYLSL